MLSSFIGKGFQPKLTDKMYPTISDFIKDIFGIYLPLPIQSFGFFLAISFLFAAYILTIEFKRKEKQGLVHPIIRTKIKGRPASIKELLLTGFITLIISYKLLGIIFNYYDFIENPQLYILSAKGNIWGGIIIALIAVVFLYIKRAKDKLPEPVTIEYKLHPHEHTTNIILIGAITGIIGSKLFHNLENIDELIANPVVALSSFSGLTFYGGLILATFAIIIYSKKNRIPVSVMADVVAPAIILAYGIGRIGCQFAGDGDWGVDNLSPKPEWLRIIPDWLWSYNYPHNIINQGIPIEGCMGNHCFILANPVFPTPIYETILCLLLFTLLWLMRKKIKTNGILFGFFLIFTGSERFLIEKIRINIHYNIFCYSVSQAEIISILLIICGIILIGILKRKNGKEN
jgi:prolipoprotein diacylglyceryl transferase